MCPVLGVSGGVAGGDYYIEEIAILAGRHLANHYERILDRVFVSAQGSWMYDSEGKKYLDFVSCYSALNVGHGHPKVKQAIIEQADRGLWAMPQGFLNPWTVECARKICWITGMDKVNFKNSGAEAVEAAMKIARKWAYVKRGVGDDKAELIFCENNFHGRTFGALAASTTPQYRDFFGPHLPGVKTVPFGDYRALEAAITKNTAAFIVEPIQGEGGIIVPPWGYLKQVRSICNNHGVLMVADEVQTGFGRTGRVFACQDEEVVPDMYVLGKALGGGLAISAVAGRKDVMEVLEPKDDGSTFGGNPFASAAAIAAIDVIVDEDLAFSAAFSGAYLKKKLEEIARSKWFIKEVRGLGLLLGIELAKSAPDSKDIMRAVLREGVIVNNTKPNVIRIAPPLNISKEEMVLGLDALEKAFSVFV